MVGNECDTRDQPVAYLAPAAECIENCYDYWGSGISVDRDVFLSAVPIS
jgi:hypothetical protein